MSNHAFVEHAAASRSWSTTFRALFVVAGLAVIGVLLAIRLANKAPSPTDQDGWLVAWLVVGLVDAVAGAALVTRLGHRRLAACLLVVGAAAVLVVVIATGSDAVSGRRSLAHLPDTGSWARPLATGVLVALVPWELVIHGRHRWLEVVWWATAVLVVATAVGEGLDLRGPGPDPFDVAMWLVATSATAAVVRLGLVWQRSRGDTGDPLLGWLVAGSVVAWLAVVPERLDIASWEFPANDVIGPMLLLATLPLLIVGVLVRALRDRPGRFHGIAHDVIGWVVLSGAIVFLYTAVVAGVGHVVGGRGPMWLLVATTVLVAISVEPLRRRVSHHVDRLVWGSRDEPLEVVREVVEHVGTDAGDELLPSLVASLQRELRLEAVALDVRAMNGWRREAALGPATTYERTVPLEQHGEVVGQLVVGWEHGPHLRARDERVLAEIAGPLALAVGWVRLADDLRRASVAVVSAREEERRRLRRDLHDGLGPSLTGVSLGVRTAIRRLERAGEPASADIVELLHRTADEVDTLVADVKRIARDLRPTALDQLGLVRAIEAFARSFGDRLEFHLSMPPEQVELPAAVEVAIYRIVTEAVTNVVRHADASNCWLTLTTGTEVEVDVVDDGSGVDDDVAVGVGWTAMRERAIELGGHVIVTNEEPHGTHVYVRIPALAP
jgi:two-component system, NarL family, sensor kinase